MYEVAASTQLNSAESIANRIAEGRIPLYAPIMIVLARSALALVAQGITTLIFFLHGNASPLRAALPWWTVNGTLVDIGCLYLLVRLTRREGIRLSDLISFNRKRLITDILLGLGLFIVVFPTTIAVGSLLGSITVYRALQPVLPDGAFLRHLPLWGLLYSRVVWWPIWSFTEELTYQGYALPRLQLLWGRRTWLTVLWVGLAWSLQHSFLPFFYNTRHFIWILIAFFPLTVTMQLLYLRFRRLTPLIVTHWAMDFASTFMILVR